MATKFSLLFDAKINEQSKKNEINKFKTAFKQADLKISPKIDDGALKQLEKNLKTTINEATKLSTLTSSFKQGGVKYNVSQQETSKGQYGKTKISADYSTAAYEAEQSLNKLYRTAIDYQSKINSSIKKGAMAFAQDYKDSLSSIEKDLSEAQTQFDKFGLSPDTTKRLQDSLNRLKIEESEVVQESINTQITKGINDMVTAYSNLAKAKSKDADETSIKALEASAEKIKQKTVALVENTQAYSDNSLEQKENLQAAIELSNAKVSGATNRQATELMTEYNKALTKSIKLEYEYQSALIKQSKSKKELTSAQIQMNEANKKAASSAKDALNNLEREIEGTKAGTRAKEARIVKEQELDASLKKLVATEKQHLSITDQVKNALSSQFGVYNLVSQGIMMARQAITATIQTVKELNEAMTDVQMVTEGSSYQTQKLATQYAEMAKQMGATTTEIAKGATEWLRQGKSIEETTELLKQSTIMSKVGAIEASKATELLTSTLNGYKMSASDASHVVDALSAVDLAAATSVEELAVALQSTANSARTSGVEFEQLIGQIGAVSEATRRSASVVGNSFKTIFSRLQSVAAGKDIDDAGDKINDVEKVLSGLGIRLRDSMSQFRNMGDVLDEIAGKWDSYSNVQQRQIATSVAGIRQAETFLALMENYDRALELQTVALESNGSAQRKFDIYLDNINARLNSLKATFQKLVYSQGTQDLFKSLISGAQRLLEVLDALVNNSITPFLVKMGAFVLIATKASSVLDKLGKSVKLMSAITTVTSGVSALTSTLGGLIMGTTSATAAMGALTTSIGAMGTAINAMLGPVGWAILAIGALTVGISTYNSVQNKANQEMMANLDTYEQQNKTISDSIALFKNEAASREELISSISSLNEEKANELSKIADTNTLREKGIDLLYQEAVAQAKVTAEENKSQAAKSRSQLEKERSFKVGSGIAGLIGAKGTTYADESGMYQEFAFEGTYKQLLDRINPIIEELKSKGSELNQTQTRQLKDLISLQEEVKSKYDPLKTSIESYDDAVKTSSMTLDEYVSSVQAAKQAQDEYAESTGIVINSVTDGYSQLQERIETIVAAQQEFSDAGEISNDTLMKLASTYPELASQIDMLAVGLGNVGEFMSSLSDVYEQDKNAYYEAILQKLQATDGYFTALGDRGVQLINQLNKEYGTDISNHASYVQAKLELEQKLLGSLKQAWSEYYNAQLQTFDTMRAYNEGVSPETVQAMSKANQAYKNAIASLNSYNDMVFNGIDNTFNKVMSNVKNASSSASKAASDAEKAYNDLLKITIDMLKKEKQLEKDALKEQLDGYKKIINARKELLEQQSDERSHSNELEERNKTISDLENKIAEIQFDTSAEGVKKRLELEAELAKEKKSLEDYQYDYSVEKQKDALDKESERMDEYINNQIDAIEKYLSETGKIEAEARRLLSERSQDTLNDLLRYNQLYGDSIDNNIIKLWNGATNAVNTYTDAVKRANAAQVGGSSSGASSNKPSHKYSIYNKAGKLIGYADNQTDVRRAMSGGAGHWIKNDTGERNTYHKGLDAGFVGGLKGNEQFVKALKGEAYVTKQQQDKFMNSVLPQMLGSASNSGSTTIENLVKINVEGNLDKDAVPQIEKAVNEAIKKINNTLFQSGFKRNANTISI